MNLTRRLSNFLSLKEYIAWVLTTTRLMCILDNNTAIKADTKP